MTLKPIAIAGLITALSLVASIAAADESIHPSQLETIIQDGSSVEQLLDVLALNNFYVDADRYTIRDGQLVSQDGITGGILRSHHPILREGFLEKCEAISCTFLYSRKIVPVSVFGWDHKYHYFWMLDGNEVVDSLPDHRRWVLRK